MSARDGQLAVLYTTVFVDTVGFGLCMPLMPYFAISFGASNFQLGLMTAGFNLGSFVGNMLLCSLSDRLGRKPILTACLFANAICYVLLPSVSSAWELIHLRILAGFFSGTVACAKVYVADCTSDEERAKCLSNVNVAFALSVCFGPGLGGLCSLVSISFGFHLMASFSILNALAASLYLAEPVRNDLSGVTGHKPSGVVCSGFLGVLWAQPQILTIVLSSGLQYLAYAPFEALGAVLFAQQYKLGTSQFSALYTIGGAVYVSTMKFAFVRVYNTVGGKRTAQIGHIFRGLCYASWAVGSNWLVALMGFILLGFGGLITPANDTTLSLMVDPINRGAVQGLNMAITAAARAFGPLLAVPFFRIWHGLPFCFSACMMLASTFVLQMLREPELVEEGRKPEQGGNSVEIVRTPPAPYRPLESFESLPAADPGSARPIATQVVRGRSSNAAAQADSLLEPLNNGERRALSAPVANRRLQYHLVEVDHNSGSRYRTLSREP